MDPRKIKPLLILAVVFLFIFYMLIKPDGSFNIQEPPALTGAFQVLDNPDFSGADSWRQTDWSSAGYYPTKAAWTHTTSTRTASQSGSDVSVYAVGYGQGTGPTALDWGLRSLYVSINGSCHNVVTWRGRMDSISLTPTGFLGMGLDFWFDAALPNGTLAPVEAYVFFRQDGLYELQPGTYHNMGYRADYNESSRDIGLSWLYMYFHPWQDTVGASSEHRFELNQYVELLKQEAGEPYKSASFYLTKVDAVMELFLASGSFTVDYVGIEQAPKS